MQAEFQYILDNYNDGSVTVSRETKVYHNLVQKLPSIIRELINDNNFIVKGSMGQGNKTAYPWISILNKNVSQTTQRGLYVVYLFKKDMSGFYLSLNQGKTNFEELYKSKAYENAKKVSAYFQDECIKSSFSDEPISLGGNAKTKDNGYAYECTNVLSKFYKSNNFTYNQLREDLLEIMNVYNDIVRHFETYDYDTVIQKVIDGTSIVKQHADEAIQDIKVAIDPNQEEPNLFVKQLTRVEPHVHKTKRFSRLTQTADRKVNWLKKAHKDAKTGLLGEEYVLEFERDRLLKLNRPDLAEKITHIAIQTDAAGYDIESFDIDKNGKVIPLYIEVKTSSTKVDSDFMVTRNELETSKKYKKNYCLFRIFDVYSDSPKFYQAFGEIEDNFHLDPLTYTAYYQPKNKRKN